MKFLIKYDRSVCHLWLKDKNKMIKYLQQRYKITRDYAEKVYRYIVNVMMK